MGGVDERLVGQDHQLGPQRIVKLAGQFRFGDAFRSHQIGPAHIADEQGVSGENQSGTVGILLPVVNQDGQTFGGVPGRLQKPQAHRADVQNVPVWMRHEGIFRLGAGAQMDGGARPVAELQMPGDKIGVEVGQKNVPQGQPVLLRVFEVLVDIALRVDDEGGLGLHIPNQVRGVRQTSEVVLLEDHELFAFLRRDGGPGGRAGPSPGSPGGGRVRSRPFNGLQTCG